MINLCFHSIATTKKETTLLRDVVGGKSVVEDDRFLEFYENNPNIIQFVPTLTLEVFGVLLAKSLIFEN